MSIQEKNGIWYAVVTYRDNFNKKKHKWVKAGGKREAQKLDAKLRTNTDTGDFIPDAKEITVEQFTESYLALAIKPHRSPGTYNDYKYASNNFNKTLGSIKLSKLRSEQIQAWANTEQVRVKPTTAKDYYNVLNIMLNTAVRWKKLSQNPCAGVTPPALNQPNSNAYTKEQVEKLMDITQDSDIYIFVLLGALCGLRSGEMAALCFNDIDLDRKRATINKQLIRYPIVDAKALKPEDTIHPLWDTIKSKRAKRVLSFAPTKTPDSSNTIPLPDIVIREIKFLKKQRILQKMVLRDAYKDHDLLAAWPDGAPFEQNYINKKFHKLIDAYNAANAEKEDNQEPVLPAYRIHDLRHTAATLMLKAKVDVKVVSRGLRHANATFTRNKYQHVLDDMLDEPADVMNAMFKAPEKPVLKRIK